MKIKRNVFRLLTAVGLLALAVTVVVAQYTGPIESLRLYQIEESYSCCSCGDDRSCTCDENAEGGATAPMGTCTRTVTVRAPDPTIALATLCNVGFGTENWCRDTFIVRATGTDAVKGISGNECADSRIISANPSDFTFTDEGDYSKEFWTLSAAGDTSYKSSSEIKVDHGMPTSNILVTGTYTNSGWYHGSVNVKSVATDTLSGIWQQWVDIGNGAVENEATIANTWSGVLTPKAKSKDKAANETAWISFEQIKVDNELPVITKITDPQGKWYNTPVALSVNGTDQYSGVRGGTITIDSDVKSFGDVPASIAYTPTEGWHTVNYQLEDRATNKSNVAGPYYFGYDVSSPSISLDSNQSFDIIGPLVTISGSAADAQAGIAKTEIKYGYNGTWRLTTGQPTYGEKNATWSHTLSASVAEGFGNFYVRSYDTAGNVSAVQTFMLESDQTAPTTGILTEGTKGPGGIYSGVVVFTANSTDTPAGVKKQWIDLKLGKGQVLNSDSNEASYSGTITPCVRAVDNVDNDSGCVNQSSVIVDNAKPRWVSYTTPDLSVVYDGDSEFSVSGADDLAGMYSAKIIIDGTEYETLGGSASVVAGKFTDGSHTLAYVLTDNAGNVLDSRNDASMKFTFTVDSTPPTIEITSPAENAFVGSSFDLIGVGRDNLGVSSIMVKLPGGDWQTVASSSPAAPNLALNLNVDSSTFSEGDNTILVKSIDQAANESETKSFAFKVDLTPPSCKLEVSGEKGAGGYYRGAITVKAVCTDEGAGIKETIINIGNGDKSVQDTTAADFTGELKPIVTSTDNAGNIFGPEEFTDLGDGSKIMVDNNAPRVTDYAVPEQSWMNTTDPISLWVIGEDTEGPLYSGVFIINEKDEEILSENNKSSDDQIFPEGRNTVYYYVTDKAGNKSEVVGFVLE